MSSLLKTSTLTQTGRSGICRQYHRSQQSRSLHSQIRTINFLSQRVETKPSIGSRRYFLGLNGIGGPGPSKRIDDDLDIPPLDLLSVIDAAKATKHADPLSNAVSNVPSYSDIKEPAGTLSISSPRQPDRNINESGDLGAVDIPPLDFVDVVPSTSEATIPTTSSAVDIPSMNLLSIAPSSGQKKERETKDILNITVGDRETSSKLPNKAQILHQEMYNIKKKLRGNKNLAKSQVSKLKLELRRKQNALDKLMGHKTPLDIEGSNSEENGVEFNQAAGAKRTVRETIQSLSVEISHLTNKLHNYCKDDHTVQTRIAHLSEEITYLTDKLRNDDISEDKASKLKNEILKKENKIRRLSSSPVETYASKLNNEILLKENKIRRLMSEEFNAKDLKKLRGLTTENGQTRRNAEGQPIQNPIRHTKSFVLPRPIISSKGLIIPNFDTNTIQTQANGSVLASSGTTSILSTVILSPPEASRNETGLNSFQQTLLDTMQKYDAANGSLFVPLQVEYRERWHASGRIPNNSRRRDNSGPLSEREVLVSRAIDRTLRPWLMKGLGECTTGKEWSGFLPENIVVNCQLQSYDTRSDGLGQFTHADPTALAINSAIAAIYQSTYSDYATKLHVPLGAAACVKLAMRTDGNVIFDPTPSEVDECAFELLYAGTRDKVLMIEFSAKGRSGYNIDPGISEDVVADALRLAKEAILPIIQHQEDLHTKHHEPYDDEALMSDEELAQMLGIKNNASSDGVKILWARETGFSSQEAESLLNDAYNFVWSNLGDAAMKSFGFHGQNNNNLSAASAYIHDGNLPSKKLRGRRETLIHNEVARLLRDDFEPPNASIADAYRGTVTNESTSPFLVSLTNHIHERIMQHAFGEAASQGCRSDGRTLNAVRPVSVTTPMFPDCVHGSSVFSRGETQVLSTATISAPRDGLPIINPLAKSPWNEPTDPSNFKEDPNVPVGSLRFLRSQVELESDMNSRRVKAGRELTGDSGILREVKRSFLHYDFPDFSTGNIKTKAGGAANRRAIGHGNLAERAILPVIPSPEDFPYSIRLTCEVTSSNGSSSMASACGATLCMLDAGVPITAPVAGVSVGLTPGSNKLLLDITGTEDHFGNMDCKVCGTYEGITAIQCDVKEPVDLDVIIDGLKLAKHGRDAILREMESACQDVLGGLRPRSNMKSTAPRVEVIKYDPNRKRDLIGPGGSVIRQLEDRFNVNLDLSQEGRCLLFGDVNAVKDAKDVIMDLVGEVEEGGIYEGTVIEIKDFGAVIELLRNKEGLLHVSEIADVKGKHPGGNLGLINEYVKVGDKIQVLCTKIDHVQGSIKLSRKQLLRNQQYMAGIEQSEDDLAQTNHNITVNNLLTENDDENSDVIFNESIADGGSEDEDELDGAMRYSGDSFDEQTIISDLELLTVPQLKEKCRAVGLTVGGTKSELIQRLVTADGKYEAVLELERLSVPELQDKCGAAGLMVTGTKDDMIRHLIFESAGRDGSLESLTLLELQDKCRAAGLIVKGTKADLIKRLIEGPDYKCGSFESLTVPQLQEKCRAAGLMVKGTKADLIKRLIEGLDEKEGSLESLTVPQLQDKCRAAGLIVGGTKAQIIERLQEHDNNLCTEN